MRLEVIVDKTAFSARGRYEEQALARPTSDFQRSMYRQDVNFLMDAPTKPGTDANRMTIVCYTSPDREKGRVWRYQSIEGTKTLQFIKIATIEDRIKQLKKEAQFPDISGTWNLGGMVGMLKQIGRFYEFTETVQSDKMDGAGHMPVWKMTGSLRKPQFDALLKSLGGMGKKGRYPADLPSDIELCIGQADYFPYRIRYLNRGTEKSLPKNLLSEINYFDVILNGEPIPEDRFTTFDKGVLPEGVFGLQDVTAQLIRSIGL